MTDELKQDTTEQQTGDALKRLITGVSANPAQIEFPTDKWGFTAGLRKEVLKAASSVRGQQDKHDLLVSTLAVLVAHLRARLPGDREAQAIANASNQRAYDDRAPRNRVGATPTNKENQNG